MNQIYKYTVAVLAIALAGCVNPEIPEAPAPAAATVRFEIHTPVLSTPSASTRAVDESFENTISNIIVLIAKPSGSAGYAIDRMIRIDQIYPIGPTRAIFTINLDSNPSPAKLLLIANPPGELIDALNGMQLNGMNEEELRSKLNFSIFNSVYGNPRTMPMTGEVLLSQISPAHMINIHVAMTRAVARHDSFLKLDPSSKSFEPTSVWIYNTHTSIQAFPDAGALDPANPARVVAPSLPDGYSQNIYHAEINNAIEADGRFCTMYLPENQGFTRPEDVISEPVKVIFGGRYNGNSYESYYRADFNPRLAGHPLGQVLRNHCYAFTITSVNSDGYATVSEAATKPSGSIGVDVTAWWDHTSELRFGPNDYLIMSDTAAEVPWQSGGVATVSIRTTMSFDWQLGTGQEISGEGMASDSNYRIEARITNHAAAFTDWQITAVALGDNRTADDSRPARLTIKVFGGATSIDITQRRADPARASQKVNVLSLSNGIGGMGVYYDGGSGTTSNAALRNLLINTAYFGPGGVVDFAGFTFDQLASYDVTPSAPVNLDRLRRALKSTDILVIPYASDPDAATVRVILDWLDDPRHVLFAMCDAGIDGGGSASCAILRNALAERLTWRGVNRMTNFGITGCVMAAPAGDNRPFIDGPFGLANQNQVGTGGLNYQLWDGIAEWAEPQPGCEVVPLAVMNTTERTNMMMVGVNPRRGVVYIGEAQMVASFLGNNPRVEAGTSGTPGYNSISTLMCNLWAWAAARVIGE